MRATTSFCSMKCMSAIASACSQQVEQQRRGDVVGQVADDPQPPPRARASAREVEFERVGLVQHEARRAREVGSCSSAARSRSISIASSVPSARASSGRGQRAAARADLHQAIAGARRDAPRRCARSTAGSCRKCWPKRLRRGGSRRAARACSARWRLSSIASCDRGAQAAGVGAAGAGQIERRAVVDRGAHDRQAERDVDGVLEAGVLEHRQALVVVHREHRIVVGRAAAGRTPCRRAAGRVASMPRARSRSIAGAMTLDLLVAEVAALAGVRIQAAHGDARRADAPPLAQVAVEDRAASGTASRW